jgi:nicotinate-nucleotide adenylyltransferase
MLILFGGSFNPPTTAHVKIAEILAEKYKEARLVITPVSDNYKKPVLAPFFNRYEMAKLAFFHIEFCEVSDYEQSKKNFLGTINTVRHFKKQDKDVRVAIGFDLLQTLHTWISFDELLENTRFIVFDRQNNCEEFISSSPYLLKYINRFEFISIDLVVSSSYYRESFDATILPMSVSSYIDEHGLYRR